MPIINDAVVPLRSGMTLEALKVPSRLVNMLSPPPEVKTNPSGSVHTSIASEAYRLRKAQEPVIPSVICLMGSPFVSSAISTPPIRRSPSSRIPLKLLSMKAVTVTAVSGVTPIRPASVVLPAVTETVQESFRLEGSEKTEPPDENIQSLERSASRV